MIIDPKTISVAKFSEVFGVSHGMAKWWLSTSGGSLREWEAIDVQAFMENRCDECGSLIASYSNIGWRTQIHQIRCEKCVAELVERGASPFDARYVS